MDVIIIKLNNRAILRQYICFGKTCLTKRCEQTNDTIILDDPCVYNCFWHFCTLWTYVDRPERSLLKITVQAHDFFDSEQTEFKVLNMNNIINFRFKCWNTLSDRKQKHISLLYGLKQAFYQVYVNLLSKENEIGFF